MTDKTNRIDFLARIAKIRRDMFDDEEMGNLARTLGIPLRTWENYEAGVIMPDLLILKFVCLTGVDPAWLLTGEGQPYAASTGTIASQGSGKGQS